MYMHLSILVVCVSLVISNVTVASEVELARASSMMYAVDPHCIQYGDHIKREVSCFDNGKFIDSFRLTEDALRKFESLKDMIDTIPQIGIKSEFPISILLKNCYVKDAQEETQAVWTLFSIHDCGMVLTNLRGKKAMLVHANELNASPSIWAILSAAMPYEFCEHMLYETGSHEISAEKRALFEDAFKCITDQDQKDTLKIGIYRGLYACEAFNILKETVNKTCKGAPFTLLQQLYDLPECVRWQSSSAYTLYDKYDKNIQILHSYPGDLQIKQCLKKIFRNYSAVQPKQQ